MTVVYLDELFAINFIANYLLLLGTGRVTGACLIRWRIVAGAVTGAVYAVLACFPEFAWLTQWPCKIGSGVLIVLIVYGGQKGLLKVTMVFLAVSSGLAGLVLAAGLLGGADLMLRNGVMYSNFDVRLLVVLFVLSYFGMSLCFRRTGRHGNKELVELRVMTGNRTIKMTALLDSGHTLTDPVNNLPVIVADYNCFADELPVGTDPEQPVDGLRRCMASGMRAARLIPYRAVGVECGLLLAIRVTSVIVGDRDMGSLLIALSPTPVSDGGRYQALIGGI